MARKVTPQSIIASNWPPPIWNRWSSSRGLSALAELLVRTATVNQVVFALGLIIDPQSVIDNPNLIPEFRLDRIYSLADTAGFYILSYMLDRGSENARLENAAPNCRTGKRGKRHVWKVLIVVNFIYIFNNTQQKGQEASNTVGKSTKSEGTCDMQSIKHKQMEKKKKKLSITHYTQHYVNYYKIRLLLY